jgi:hypothetical protein
MEVMVIQGQVVQVVDLVLILVVLVEQEFQALMDMGQEVVEEKVVILHIAFMALVVMAKQEVMVQLL